MSGSRKWRRFRSGRLSLVCVRVLRVISSRCDVPDGPKSAADMKSMGAFGSRMSQTFAKGLLRLRAAAYRCKVERLLLAGSVNTRRRQEADLRRDSPAGQSQLAAPPRGTRSRPVMDTGQCQIRTCRLVTRGNETRDCLAALTIYIGSFDRRSAFVRLVNALIRGVTLR